MSEQRTAVTTATPTSGDEVDVYAWFQAFWRNRRFVTAIIAAAVAAAGVVGILSPRYYTAQAQVLVAVSPGFSPPASVQYDPTSTVSIITDLLGGARPRSNTTHAAAMRDPLILKEALAKLRPEDRREFKRYEKDLNRLPVAVVASLNSDIIKVMVTSRSRKAAMALADAIIQTYSEYTYQTNVNLAKEAADKLRPEADKVLRDLQAAEQALNARRQTTGIYDARTALEEASVRVSEIRDEISDTRVALATAKGGGSAYLSSHRGSSPGGSHTGNRAAPGREQQAGGPVRLTEAELRRKMDALNEELTLQDAWLSRLSQEEDEQTRLTSLVSARRGTYDSLLEQLSALTGSAPARLPTIAAIGRATAPETVSRGLTLKLITGLLLGLVLAVGATTMREYRSARAGAVAA